LLSICDSNEKGLRTTPSLNAHPADRAAMRIARGLVRTVRAEFISDLSLPDRSIPDLINLALLTE